MDTGKVIAAVVAGVAVGAVLGILFAPDKGSATREKIADSIKGFGQDIADRAEGFLADKSSKVKSQAQNFADKALS